MPSYVTPKKNTAYVFYVSLEDQANAGLFKASPTLAAGDVKVAVDDGAPANLTTLPAVDADFTKRVKVSLSADEMNGDNVTVIFSDAAGAEWYDLTINIQTTAQQIDDLSTLGGTAQTGDSYAVVTNATYGLDKLARTGADSDTLETLSDQIDTIDVSGTAQAVWEYVTRTLTQSSTSTTDSTAAGTIARRRGDSWSISLTVGAITGYTSLWFTLKHSRDDADSAAVLQVKLNASTTDDGLLYVNGAAATDDTKASITVSDATTGAIVIAVDESITDDLPVAALYYDVQALISNAVSTPDNGTFTITADVTRAIV